MRHKVFGRKLARSTKHRKALFRNLLGSLILNGRLKTTLAKAKSVKSLIDKLITKAKDSSVHNRRLLISFLGNKSAANKLMDEIAPKYKQRTSGFTRLIKLGIRRGDNALMASLEFIDSSDLVSVKSKPKLKSKKDKKSTPAPSKHKKISASQPKLKVTSQTGPKGSTVRTTHK